MERIIFHIDVNSAFLSWEACYRIHHLGGTLDLRTIPSAVGGDQSKRHGIILTKSIPAKKYHIKTGEPIVDARRKCPELVIVPPNYTLYSHASRAMIEILQEYTDTIEKYSIDEAFLDMTNALSDRIRDFDAIRLPAEIDATWQNEVEHRAVLLAWQLKERIREELGFTVNIGISSNKLLAKMASDFQKPDQVHTLWPSEIEHKMWPLPVEDLFYVGYATAPKLHRLGIHTIGALAQFDPDILYHRMKSHGLLVRQFACGIDDSPVIPQLMEAPPKGYGNSCTTIHDVTDRQEAYWHLLSLAETVSQRIRADEVRVSCVDISIRDSELRFYGHQKQLRSPTDLTLEIYDAACRCFDELWTGYPIRHLGIHTSKVSHAVGRQVDLFDRYDYGKLRQAECAVDEIRTRYGNDAIKRARFVSAPGCADPYAIDHMNGGISRERRTVDYHKETIS
ncbi:MAG: DNA polymerase IV [Lachnospiraceae bacterium]|nr:DNA polymerase IV [Lachnospiraceae bacterium]